jgi:hypothetical protein
MLAKALSVTAKFLARTSFGMWAKTSGSRRVSSSLKFADFKTIPVHRYAG